MERSNSSIADITDLETLKATLDRFFNPNDPPPDGGYVKIDEVGDSPEEHPRGISWAGRILEKLRNRAHILKVDDSRDRKHVCIFVTGLPGSGKSTELKHLTGKDGGLSKILDPVYVNVEDSLELKNLEVVDLLLIILSQVRGYVKGPSSADEGLISRLVKSLKLDASLGPIKFALEMKDNDFFRKTLHESTKANQGALVHEVMQELVELNKWHHQKTRRELVIILDSLEKAAGAQESLFTPSSSLSKLPIHAIITVPPHLYVQNNLQGDFLPMIKLRGRDGQRFEPGFSAARDLILCRARLAGDPELHRILGSTKATDRIDQLIESTGGYPREIIRLVQELMAYPARDYPLSDYLFEQTLHSYRAQIRALVDERDLQVLVDIALGRRQATEPEAKHLLIKNILLRYQNREQWFAIHPAILDAPLFVKALAQRQAADSAGAAPPAVAVPGDG